MDAMHSHLQSWGINLSGCMPPTVLQLECLPVSKTLFSYIATQNTFLVHCI